jgi:mannose-6-phosphate isomerase-like protein (cupin superfamily)
LEFGKGQSPRLVSYGCDEVVYALEGEGAIEIDGETYNLEPEMGVYIRPYQAFCVWNPNPEPIVLISSQCPEPESGAKVIGAAEGGAGESFSTAGGSSPGAVARAGLEHLAPSAVDSASTLAATGSSKGKSAPLVRLADRKALPTGDRWYRVLIDDEVGCTQVTQFVGSIPPGRAPDHFHLYEEVLFILRGEGRMWAGKTSTPIAAGSCVYLPKEQVHCVENTGTDELRLLGVFYPAGSPAARYDADS